VYNYNLCSTGDLNITTTHVAKTPAPHDLQIYQSFREVLLNRTLARFAAEDPLAASLHDWLSDAFVSDELFFATLNRLQPLPRDGGVVTQKDPEEEDYCPVEPRYSLWKFDGHCFGHVTRSLCHFSLRDFPNLSYKSRYSLFVNKFNASSDAVATACWSERVGGGTFPPMEP
jgi:hypothetical protein